MQNSTAGDDYAARLKAYCDTGREAAQRLGNRGPARFDQNGKLEAHIQEAFWQHGFYVLEKLIDSDEIALLRQDINFLIENAPAAPGTPLTANGKPAFGQEFARIPYTLIRPLTDPWGGTTLLGGRHPTKMTEPRPAGDAPDYAIYLMHGMCQIMPSGLRLYGHPDLLSIAATINGDDFVPYSDAIFVKQPGLGGSVAWHQDGVTHWDSPDWDEGIHGFNFQVQLYRCTPQNCLWVVPGTHKRGRIDIKQLIADNDGSEMLPGAVPLTCEPGDVTIVNRQALHASFANTSPDLRVSLTFGFHRRNAVLGARGAQNSRMGVGYFRT